MQVWWPRDDFPYARKAAASPAARPSALELVGRLPEESDRDFFRRGYSVLARYLVNVSIILFTAVKCEGSTLVE